MKKTITILTISLMLIVTTALVFAQNQSPAPNNYAFSNQNTAPLTPEQKDTLAALYKQKLEVQKQILQARVQFGQITQQQADNMIARHQQHFERMQANGYACPQGPDNDRHHNGNQGMGNGQNKNPNCPYQN